MRNLCLPSGPAIPQNLFYWFVSWKKTGMLADITISGLRKEEGKKAGFLLVQSNHSLIISP